MIGEPFSTSLIVQLGFSWLVLKLLDCEGLFIAVVLCTYVWGEIAINTATQTFMIFGVINILKIIALSFRARGKK